jgi:clan AA aspartic protease
MIVGQVLASREAVIPLEIYNSQGQVISFSATIDTGFTEYLTLPPAQISALGLTYRSTTQVRLGDGRIVRLRIYSATIIWDGQRRDLSIHETDGGALVGMSLLYGYKMTMETVDGGSVILEALP